MLGGYSVRLVPKRGRTSCGHWMGVLAYLVCPMRCTRPIACSSTPVFSKGSTSSTWVASMIFNPLEPEWNGSRSTLTSGLVLNSVRLFWWGEGGDKDLAAIAKATGLKSLCAVLADVVRGMSWNWFFHKVDWFTSLLLTCGVLSTNNCGLCLSYH